MGKNLVKVYRVLIVRPLGDGFECCLVDAIANETAYNYTFSHAEAQKSRCHKVGKTGEWAPTPKEALERFYKGNARQERLYERQLNHARMSMQGAQMLAKSLNLPPVVVEL